MFAGPLETPQLSFGKKLLAFNWLFVALITCIAGVGAASLYSVAGGKLDPWAETHVIRYFLGLGLLFGVALIDIRVWLRLAYPVYLLALALLVAVPIIGTESGGAQRWLQFGGVSMQPSEFAKPAFVVMCAWLFSETQSRDDVPSLPLVIEIGRASCRERV